MSRKTLLIIILTLSSSFIYAESNIQKSEIFVFDLSRACDVVALKLKKMEAVLDEKKMTIAELLKSLRSAATPDAKYGNILLDYHRTLDQFKSMKKDYDQLILERENHCMPNLDEKSTN
ncbi:hypothetical protein QE380_003078 [Acinetobacter baylyi]|uniref:Uncharacterized protein n=1 Tax=Acinetobacter baylyi TaxID=202950 RepID=A0ABU0V009_ACIBI|nr:hypothetical protein [Acinetobacter baylyi]MDQ1210155.1 hypothetical protein [Acinetobacter baylyi]MDR6106250.1 hypothetical protein [Acinetobacter baylyi]MDR6187024.1 hypothetical protein [Acinetobacter baylyi]